MQYKGKEIQDIPKNTKYVPIVVRTPNSVNNKAITDIEVVGDSKYARIGEDWYLWSIDEGKPIIKLTDSHYKAVDLGYDTSIEIVPDGLDASELTTTTNMFSRGTDVDSYFNQAGDTPTMSDLQALANNFDSSMVYSHLKEAPEMDTSNVTDMSYMFGSRIEWDIPEDYDDPFSPIHVFEYTVGCKELTSVPYYDTNEVLNFKCMFAGCSSLPKVYPHEISLSYEICIKEEGWNSLRNMFAGSSVEEVTFMPNTPTIMQDWFDSMGNIEAETLLKTLDPIGRLKKITFTFFIGSDNYVIVDKDGWHYSPDYR